MTLLHAIVPCTQLCSAPPTRLPQRGRRLAQRSYLCLALSTCLLMHLWLGPKSCGVDKHVMEMLVNVLGLPRCQADVAFRPLR
jgi:hypothetical protein